MAITQLEYDYLISQDKEFDDLMNPIALGPPPIQWTRKINSLINTDTFLLDFYRGSIELIKYTYNKRYRQTIILLRYDNAGRHTNPDGQEFNGPHVHLYCEGYNDKFAFSVTQISINASDKLETVLRKILYFCNVKRIPIIEIPMY
jgi:hypothetical protein